MLNAEFKKETFKNSVRENVKMLINIIVNRPSGQTRFFHYFLYSHGFTPRFPFSLLPISPTIFD